MSKNKQQYIEQEYDSMTHETDTVLYTSKKFQKQLRMKHKSGEPVLPLKCPRGEQTP